MITEPKLWHSGPVIRWGVGPGVEWIASIVVMRKTDDGGLASVDYAEVGRTPDDALSALKDLVAKHEEGWNW